MIPFRDYNPSGRVPWVMFLLVLANGVVFFYEVSLGSGVDRFIRRYGLIPTHFLYFLQSPSGTFSNTFLPIFTSMFLHGGWLHVVSNLWYLWIFGDNVEDRFGHIRFLLFYLACGAAAALCHVAFNPYSNIPTIGASGAIAGVLGAYLVCFPHARVLTLLPVFLIWQVVEVPAVIVLGFWFILQVIYGMGSVGTQIGGVAWWAHIGGFLAGIFLALLIPPSRSYRRRRAEMGYWG